MEVESWVARIWSAPAWAAQPGQVAASCRLPVGPTRRPKQSRRSEANPGGRSVHCCDAPGDWVVAVLVAEVWQGAGALPVGPVGHCGSACLRADVPRGRGSRAEVGPNRDHHPPMQPVPSSTVSNSSFRCRRQPVVDEAGAILLVNPECFTQKVMRVIRRRVLASHRSASCQPPPAQDRPRDRRANLPEVLPDRASLGDPADLRRPWGTGRRDRAVRAGRPVRTTC